MKSGITFAGLAVVLMLAIASFSQQAPNPADEQLIKKANGIHERALTLDTHVDIPGSNYDPGEKSTAKCTLPKMEKGGLKGVFLAVFVGQKPESTSRDTRQHTTRQSPNSMRRIMSRRSCTRTGARSPLRLPRLSASRKRANG